MKRIEAVICPERLSGVLTALTDVGYGRATVIQVQGHGEELGFTRQWRAMTYVVDVTPKVKIEVLVHDPFVERVVAVIREHASTGAFSDGTITIVPVESVIDVHSGEHIGRAVLAAV